MNKKEFTITGIDCAHCASKVENKVAETIGIKNVSFNFISKILSFEVEEGQLLKEKSEEVKHIISSIVTTTIANLLNNTVPLQR